MSTPGGFLSAVYAIIVEQGLGKARSKILHKQLESKSGTAENSLSHRTTHILVGNNVRLSRVPHLLKIKSLPEGVLVLRADWLSSCLVKGEKVEHSSYVVHPEPSPHSSPAKHSNTPTSGSPATSPLKQQQQQQESTSTPVPPVLSEKVDADNEQPFPDNEKKESDQRAAKSPDRTETVGGTSTLTSPKVQHTTRGLCVTHYKVIK